MGLLQQSNVTWQPPLARCHAIRTRGTRICRKLKPPGYKNKLNAPTSKSPDGRYLRCDLFAGKPALPNKVTFNKLELVWAKWFANCAHLECLFALRSLEANEVWDDIFRLKLNLFINFFNYIFFVFFFFCKTFLVNLYYDHIGTWNICYWRLYIVYTNYRNCNFGRIRTRSL